VPNNRIISTAASPSNVVLSPASELLSCLTRNVRGCVLMYSLPTPFVSLAFMIVYFKLSDVFTSSSVCYFGIYNSIFSCSLMYSLCFFGIYDSIFSCSLMYSLCFFDIYESIFSCRLMYSLPTPFVALAFMIVYFHVH
jgi:hypothetical protein